MLSIFQEFVNKMQSTNGRIEKENYLVEYKDVPQVKFILNFLLNPYVVSGISKKKIKKFEGVEFDDMSMPFFTVEELLFNIMENNTGKDEVLISIEKFIRRVGKEYRQLISDIITKDLKLGVQSTTINKVYGKGTIPTFDVMLANKYFDAPDKYVPDGTSFMLTTKLDGVRCVCVRDFNGVKFFSRQGQPIFDLVEIEEEAMRLPCGFVYDGELLLDNVNNLDSKDLYRATVKVTGSDSEKRNLIFNVFDLIGIEEFKQGYDGKSAHMRKSMLGKIIDRRNFKYIKEVKPLYIGEDKSKIQEWLDKITSEGGEGVMINISDAPYECRRSKHLLKVKKMQTADVLVLDVQEGTGQNINKLGAILVKFIGPDSKEYTCYCGSGFTLQEREEFWKDKNLILNKIVEVQYFEISQNEDGKYSFRFPVFKHIRNDKFEISMY